VVQRRWVNERRPDSSSLQVGLVLVELTWAVGLAKKCGPLFLLLKTGDVSTSKKVDKEPKYPLLSMCERKTHELTVMQHIRPSQRAFGVPTHRTGPEEYAGWGLCHEGPKRPAFPEILALLVATWDSMRMSAFVLTHSMPWWLGLREEVPRQGPHGQRTTGQGTTAFHLPPPGFLT